MVDAHGWYIFAAFQDCQLCGCLEWLYIYAIAWASALSVLTIRAMREPWIVRWAREDSHAIFLFSLKIID